MPGQNPTFQHGPRSYEVSEAVKGGQVLESSTVASTTKLPVAKVGTANSAKVLGVAFRDAIPTTARDSFENSTAGYANYNVTDTSVVGETTAVYHDCWAKVQYTGACAERQPIKAAAAGAVAPWVDGTDAPNLRIGWCAVTGGISAAGTGLARILV